MVTHLPSHSIIYSQARVDTQSRRLRDEEDEAKRLREEVARGDRHTEEQHAELLAYERQAKEKEKLCTSELRTSGLKASLVQVQPTVYNRAGKCRIPK